MLFPEGFGRLFGIAGVGWNASGLNGSIRMAFDWGLARARPGTDERWGARGSMDGGVERGFDSSRGQWRAVEGKGALGWEDARRTEEALRTSTGTSRRRCTWQVGDGAWRRDGSDF